MAASALDAPAEPVAAVSSDHASTEPAAVSSAADAQAELPWAAADEPASVARAAAGDVEFHDPPDAAAPGAAQQVPANDVVSGPMIQPIVIGSESAPPLERKRGWWRRR